LSLGPVTGQQLLDRVAENLHRTESTGIDYAILKPEGKYIRRSLKTSGRQWNRRPDPAV
jgi:hypothetical protein